MTKQFTVDIDHDNNNFPFHSLADYISEFDIENYNSSSETLRNANSKIV